VTEEPEGENRELRRSSRSPSPNFRLLKTSVDKRPIDKLFSDYMLATVAMKKHIPETLFCNSSRI